MRIPFLRCCWFLLAATALAACGETVLYQPVSFEQVNGRAALFVESTPIAPLPEEMQRAFVDRLEAQLRESPYLGRVLTRAEVRRLLANDRALLLRYGLYGETLSVLGITDRETSVRLAEVGKVELLLMTQVQQMVCDQCETPYNDMVASITVVEAVSGRLLWRVHVRESLLGEDTAGLRETAASLSEAVATEFERFVRPKWHRLRFRHLAPAASA